MKNALYNIKEALLLLHELQKGLLFHGVMVSLLQTLNQYLPLFFITICINAYTSQTEHKNIVILVAIIVMLLFLCRVGEHIAARNINIAKTELELELEKRISEKRCAYPKHL